MGLGLQEIIEKELSYLICCVNKKTTWSAWSLYLPKDYKIIYPAKTMLATIS